MNDISSIFVNACRVGDISYVKKLIEVDIDVKNKGLLQASRYGHVDIIELLLKNGADIEATNEYGSTPLVLAACWHNISVVKLLLDPQIEGVLGAKSDCMTYYLDDMSEIIKELIENSRSRNIKPANRFI